MDEVMGTGNDVKREKGREAPSGGRVTIRELAEAAGSVRQRCQMLFMETPSGSLLRPSAACRN